MFLRSACDQGFLRYECCQEAVGPLLVLREVWPWDAPGLAELIVTLVNAQIWMRRICQGSGLPPPAPNCNRLRPLRLAKLESILAFLSERLRAEERCQFSESRRLNSLCLHEGIQVARLDSSQLAVTFHCGCGRPLRIHESPRRAALLIPIRPVSLLQVMRFSRDADCGRREARR